MSLTVADILKLPTLREARVVAGHAGLDRFVSSISVSEYTRGGRPHGSQLRRIAADHYGNELIISALASAKESVARQCASLQEFFANGSVGLILFYVGVILPSIDPLLIAEADALGFPLIAMPENRSDLRYSEVIYEVIEAIIKDRDIAGNLKNDVMESVLRGSPHQHGVSAVVHTLGDRLQACVLVTGQDGTILDAAFWPRGFRFDNFLEVLAQKAPVITLQGVEHAVYTTEVNDLPDTGFQLHIFKRGEPLAPDLVYQAAEAVQAAVSMWSPGYGRKAVNELLRAIMQDEPYKVQLLANTFNINIETLRTLWLIQPAQTPSSTRTPGEVVRRAAEELLHICPMLLTEVYNGWGMLLIGGGPKGEDMQSISESFVQAQTQAGTPVILTLCSELGDMAALREAFMLNVRNMPLAQVIYPTQHLFTLSEMRFAQRCQSILSGGEGEIARHVRILAPLSTTEADDQRLLKTLEVYFFDAGSSVAGTAERMFLHRNTVQYRLNQARERLRVSVTRMPEMMDLYVALAIRRIMQTSPLHKPQV